MPRSASISASPRRTSAAPRPTPPCWPRPASSRKDDAAAITRGLTQIAGEIEAGTFTFKRALEDIHMNVESRLAEIIGEAAGRLHTARSRNDQVALDFRLWVRDTVDALDRGLRDLQLALAEKAFAHADAVMPGFTHLQSAQPVTLGHHLLAYVEMIGRDRGRLHDARKRMNECPLGAAALAGTSFPIDRHAVAVSLGFEGPTRNSLDTVADRDFVLEVLSAAAICAIHLSRFAEEIVLWATPQFGFAALSDKFSTGSSIMPQKRNPDAAELVRGKTGRVIGALTALLIVMKGLPLAYSKDMQEDKEGTFDALDALALMIAAMAGMVRDLKPDLEAHGSGRKLRLRDRDRPRRLAGARARPAVPPGPSRDGPHRGRCGRARPRRSRSCRSPAMQGIEPRITAAVYDVLGVRNSVASRTSFGGTAPANVRAQAEHWIRTLADEAAG